MRRLYERDGPGEQQQKASTQEGGGCHIALQFRRYQGSLKRKKKIRWGDRKGSSSTVAKGETTRHASEIVRRRRITFLKATEYGPVGGKLSKRNERTRTKRFHTTWKKRGVGMKRHGLPLEGAE